MSELSQVRAVVIAALTQAGVSTVAAFPGKATAVDAATATVDITDSSAVPTAMGGYLGSVYDEAAGTVREVYGKLLNMTVAVNIRAPSAAACRTACETAAETLLDGSILPAGLRATEQSWQGIEWDSANHCFLRRGTFSCRAWFTARTQEEEPTVLDFILKGVLTT